MCFVLWDMAWVPSSRVCLLVCLSEPTGEFEDGFVGLENMLTGI